MAVTAPSIHADHVSYSYRRRTALHDVTFTVDGGVIGLVGPNGAGKSTLIRLLATLLTPSSGTLTVCGHDTTRERNLVRPSLGYLPQSFDIMEFSTVLRNAEFAAWAHGLTPSECPSAARQTLEKVGLWSRRNSRARSLSGGMRQRLGIACTIVHKPRVVLLDEPSVGLDPVQRIRLRELVEQIAVDSTIILSTHLIEDLSAMTSQILVLDEGRLRFCGTMTDIESMASISSPGMSAAEVGYTKLLEPKDSI